MLLYFSVNDSSGQALYVFPPVNASVSSSIILHYCGQSKPDAAALVSAVGLSMSDRSPTRSTERFDSGTWESQRSLRSPSTSQYMNVMSVICGHREDFVRERQVLRRGIDIYKCFRPCSRASWAQCSASCPSPDNPHTQSPLLLQTLLKTNSYSLHPSAQ